MEGRPISERSERIIGHLAALGPVASDSERAA
jgi:hypothetical protein